MDECKPLDGGPAEMEAMALRCVAALSRLTNGGGLTLVYFPAQPQLFLTQKNTLNTPYCSLTPLTQPLKNL